MIDEDFSSPFVLYCDHCVLCLDLSDLTRLKFRAANTNAGLELKDTL